MMAWAIGVITTARAITTASVVIVSILVIIFLLFIPVKDTSCGTLN
jgi:hypothetical protein